MAIAYYQAALLGLALRAEAGGVAVFWPASGVAVGALLAFGRRNIGPIAAGIAAATIVANITSDRPPLLAVAFAVANTLEFVVVAKLVNRVLGSHLKFDSLGRVLGVFLAALTGCALGSGYAAFALAISARDWSSLLPDWQVWFLSDLIGVIAIAPFVVGLRTLVSQPGTWRDHAEGLALIGIVSLTTLVISPDSFAFSGAANDLPIALLFPPLLLLAIRHPLTYSPMGASAAALILVASFISTTSISADHGLFAAQLTIFAMVACSLSLSALIGERKASERRQKMMVLELNHRVKNALTLVQAVVERSRESASSMDDFYAALGGRIRSMARTHSLLSRERWHGLELRELVSAELAPYQDASERNVHGPAVVLSPAIAQSLNLVLHELSTNAAKHGALSQDGGTVSVTWVVEPGDLHETRTLVITWKEWCATPVGEIGSEGFGMSTIRDLLHYEAGGTVTLTFPSTGARCIIRLPISTDGFTLG